MANLAGGTDWTGSLPDYQTGSHAYLISDDVCAVFTISRVLRILFSSALFHPAASGNFASRGCSSNRWVETSSTEAHLTSLSTVSCLRRCISLATGKRGRLFVRTTDRRSKPHGKRYQSV